MRQKLQRLLRGILSIARESTDTDLLPPLAAIIQEGLKTLETEPLTEEHGMVVLDRSIYRGLFLPGGYMINDDAPFTTTNFSQVWKATHTMRPLPEEKTLQQTVVVKVWLIERELNPERRAEMLGRFYREIEVLCTLQSPFIVEEVSAGSITRDGTTPALCYLVLKAVEGGDLHNLVERGGPIKAPGLIMKWLAQCLEALACVHAAGIVHRDVKPANIFVDGRNNIRLGDFGLVSAPSGSLSRLTHDDASMGTPAFMAPEQLGVLTNEVDGRADFFALGVTMHYLLTGKLPFGEKYTEIIGRMNEKRRPSTLNDPPTAAPRELTHFIGRCMEINPDDRFLNAQEALKELTAVAGPNILLPHYETGGLPTQTFIK